jgi:hypothetical protein
MLKIVELGREEGAARIMAPSRQKHMTCKIVRESCRSEAMYFEKTNLRDGSKDDDACEIYSGGELDAQQSPISHESLPVDI